MPENEGFTVNCLEIRPMKEDLIELFSENMPRALTYI